MSIWRGNTPLAGSSSFRQIDTSPQDFFEGEGARVGSQLYVAITDLTGVTSANFNADDGNWRVIPESLTTLEEGTGIDLDVSGSSTRISIDTDVVPQLGENNDWTGVNDFDDLRVNGVSVASSNDLNSYLPLTGGTLTGALNVGTTSNTQNLTVTGLTTMTGNASVTGNATFSNDVEVVGNLDVGDVLSSHVQISGGDISFLSGSSDSAGLVIDRTGIERGTTRAISIDSGGVVNAPIDLQIAGVRVANINSVPALGEVPGSWDDIALASQIPDTSNFLTEVPFGDGAGQVGAWAEGDNEHAINPIRIPIEIIPESIVNQDQLDFSQDNTSLNEVVHWEEIFPNGGEDYELEFTGFVRGPYITVSNTTDDGATDNVNYNATTGQLNLLGLTEEQVNDFRSNTSTNRVAVRTNSVLGFAVGRPLATSNPEAGLLVLQLFYFNNGTTEEARNPFSSTTPLPNNLIQDLLAADEFEIFEISDPQTLVSKQGLMFNDGTRLLRTNGFVEPDESFITMPATSILFSNESGTIRTEAPFPLVTGERYVFDHDGARHFFEADSGTAGTVYQTFSDFGDDASRAIGIRTFVRAYRLTEVEASGGGQDNPAITAGIGLEWGDGTGDQSPTSGGTINVDTDTIATVARVEAATSNIPPFIHLNSHVDALTITWASASGAVQENTHDGSLASTILISGDRNNIQGLTDDTRYSLRWVDGTAQSLDVTYVGAAGISDTNSTLTFSGLGVFNHRTSIERGITNGTLTLNSVSQPNVSSIRAVNGRITKDVVNGELQDTFTEYTLADLTDLGVGTSNLQLGTTSTTALAGDTQVGNQVSVGLNTDGDATSITIDGTTTDIAGGGGGTQFADQQALEDFITNKEDFRTDIGAGTSNLELGTTAGTALAGDTQVGSQVSVDTNSDGDATSITIDGTTTGIASGAAAIPATNTGRNVIGTTVTDGNLTAVTLGDLIEVNTGGEYNGDEVLGFRRINTGTNSGSHTYLPYRTTMTLISGDIITIPPQVEFEFNRRTWYNHTENTFVNLTSSWDESTIEADNNLTEITDSNSHILLRSLESTWSSPTPPNALGFNGDLGIDDGAGDDVLWVKVSGAWIDLTFATAQASGLAGLQAGTDPDSIELRPSTNNANFDILKNGNGELNVEDIQFNDDTILPRHINGDVKIQTTGNGSVELSATGNGTIHLDSLIVNGNDISPGFGVTGVRINGIQYEQNEQLAMHIDQFGTITNTSVTGVNFDVTPNTTLAITYRTVNYYVTYTRVDTAWTQRFYTVDGHSGSSAPFWTNNLTT